MPRPATRPLKTRRLRTYTFAAFLLITIFIVVFLIPFPFVNDLILNQSDIDVVSYGISQRHNPSHVSAYPSPQSHSQIQQLTKLLDSVSHLTNNPPSNKSFVLFRAIGNDLPPRHAIGQTYENVKFILEHESPKPDLDVRWYVNRIVNEDEQLKIINLLIQHHQLFTVDPLNLTEYQDADFKFRTNLKEPDVLRSRFFRDTPKSDVATNQRNRAWDIMLERKNQFIIHNNPARNAMLDLGRASGATYILPWDGNCFINSKSWENITSTIRNLSQSNSPKISKLYYTVPMSRVTDNNLLKDDKFVPKSTIEEPQIIFHRDSRTRFDGSKAYGYRPKVDLLWRLKVPEFQFKDKNGNPNPKAVPHKMAKDVQVYDSVRPAGWTVRLFSGNERLEKSGAAMLRGKSRSDGVELIAAQASRMVAERIHGYCRKGTLFMYDRRVLSQRLEEYGRGISGEIEGRVEWLVGEAKRWMEIGVVVSSDEEGLKKAGEALVGAGLAGLFTGERKFVEWGSGKVREWLVKAKTRVDTKSIRGVRSGLHVCEMLDGVRLLWMGGAVTDGEFDEVTEWARGYAAVMEEDEGWGKVYYSQGREAVLGEAAAGCVYAFADEFEKVLRRTGLGRGRMHEQFGGNGSFLGKEGLLGLEAWAMLGEVGERVGVDVWGFKGEEFLKGQKRAVLAEALATVLDEEKKGSNGGPEAGRLEAVLGALGQRRLGRYWDDVADVVGDLAVRAAGAEEEEEVRLPLGSALGRFWQLALV